MSFKLAYLFMQKGRPKQGNSLQKDQQMIIQQCLLQKELYQLKQIKQRTYEQLEIMQANCKRYEQSMNNYESKHINLRITLQQLQQQDQRIEKDNLALQRQLQHFQDTLQKTILHLDATRKKYLFMSNQIVLEQQTPQIATKTNKCKFFPSILQDTYRKFSIHEYQKGYLVKKISKQIGFTKISNQIAFPSQGIFQYTFKIMQIQRNQFILGVISKNSPNEIKDSYKLLYFNFRNQSIEYNGVQIKSFSYSLCSQQQVRLIINMNDKIMYAHIDNIFSQFVDFSAFDIAQQSLYLFIALSNDDTTLYFQNS